MVLEKTLGSSLHCKEIKSVSPKWNQSWIFIGRTDAEAETLILWIPDVKSRLTRKHPDFGKDWRQERRAWQKTSWLDGIPIQWTWVSASSRRWWRAGKPGMLQSMGSQRVRHEWVTEQQQNIPLKTSYKIKALKSYRRNNEQSWYFFQELFCASCVLPLEKAMAPHSSTLAWKIPWMEEPGRLQSMRSRRVGHNWATSLSLFTFMHWRRKWQSTPVFLPGESQGWESLTGCRLWGRTELDTTEAT